MNFPQSHFLLILGIVSFLIFLKGLYESSRRNNAFGDTFFLSLFGIFVWADAIVFGLFWSLVSILFFYIQNWLLFLLTVSVFWVVRSLGETMYWFHEQFAGACRNKPDTLRGFWLVKNDAIWCIYQIYWQCMTVASILVTLYLLKVWLRQ